jgi:hypothetical protein
MRTNEFDQHAIERRIRDVHDQSVFVARDVKYDPIVSHKIHGISEHFLYIRWSSPIEPCSQCCASFLTVPRLLGGVPKIA